MATPHSEERKPEHTEHGSGAVLFVLVIGTFLAPLDSSIVNIALPSIASQFGERLTAVSWVASAYLLASSALLLTMGRLGDLWGLRKLYVSGLLSFGLGSLACAFSGSLKMLIAARVFQAIGAAMLFAAGPALVVKTFPANRRGWALGYVALAVSAGLTVGPALGGLLVGAFGWPSIFLINVPLAVIVAAFAWRLLRDDPLPGEPFDILGALLAAATLLLLLLGLGDADRSGILSWQVIGPVVASLLAGALFVWWESRAAAPMVDLSLFSSRAFSAGLGAATLAYLSLFAVTFTMPFYLLRVQGLDAEAAGLLLTLTPLAMAAIAPTAGRLSDRHGSRGLATTGVAVLAVGLLGASFLTTTSPLWAVGVTLLIIGSGMAIFQTPNTSAVMRSTPRARAGVGSAFIAEARNVGMVIGIAITAAIVGGSVGGTGLPNGEGRLEAGIATLFSAGMSNALRVAAVVAAAAAVLSWFGRPADAVESESAKP
ncbi:MAG: MFS transporter [Actinobacteria bacterium HGW-Actinobacteria-7]|nr:MAG: MFS transporter [Actinobacteria bacterium HGW-Actinobacteria-7]